MARLYVEIGDALHQSVKEEALKRKKSLKEFTITALSKELKRKVKK